MKIGLGGKDQGLEPLRCGSWPGGGWVGENSHGEEGVGDLEQKGGGRARVPINKVASCRGSVG